MTDPLTDQQFLICLFIGIPYLIVAIIVWVGEYVDGTESGPVAFLLGFSWPLLLALRAPRLIRSIPEVLSDFWKAVKRVDAA